MRDKENPFYIGENRAMVSLGPLTKNKYCPYSCAFCYVKSEFMKYVKMEIEDIIEFLIKNKDKYDIVYISGDTDSFAQPRTEKALELLKKISENIDADILITTRTIFKDEDIQKLKNVSDYLKVKGHKLISCISISRLFSADYIEPYPIPTPEERIELLEKLKKNGLYTILATRPFLPIIDADEYIEIIKRSKNYIDAVLGETWYADEKLINDVCKYSDIGSIKFVNHNMDFDDNDYIWKCYEANETVEKVEEYCRQNNIHFYMRSRPAVEYIRNIN